MKVLSQNLIKYVQSERNILSLMSHPFIVRLYHAFQNERKLFLILEYCPGIFHIFIKLKKKNYQIKFFL